MKRNVLHRIGLCILALLVIFTLPARATTAEAMVANLEASNFRFNGKSYAGKKTAMLIAARQLLEEEFEPTFVAGLLGNIAEEGSFGLFENIFGYSEARLLQVFPSLANPNHSHNYVAHMNGYTAYDDCGHDHSEYRQYNGKYIYNGFSLSAVAEMLAAYQAEGWKAKFGLGMVQWTGYRTVTLVSKYQQYANGADTITYEQCAAAEIATLAHEFRNDYARVYNGWKNNNADLTSAAAAYDAGWRVCYYYEIPASRETKSAIRGNIASDIYRIMTEGIAEVERHLYCRPLKKGDRGTDVREMQQRLMDLGYSMGSYGADGDFGSTTEARVRDFQTDRGLTVNGIFDEICWDAIEAPTVANVRATDITPDGFTVTCAVADNVGVARVTFSAVADGESEYLCREGSMSGGTATFRVSTADHGERAGRYLVEVCAYDATGNISASGDAAAVSVDVPARPADYTVTYDANGGLHAPAAQGKADGIDLTLSDAVPTYAGHAFLGWATSADAAEAEYQPGDIYDADADLHLYAVWATLPRLILPRGIEAIDAEAFMGSGAAVVVIPDGCQAIGARAFADCMALREAHIPASVASIAATAFSGCPDGLTVYGAAGSVAEDFARTQGYAFVAVGEG